MVWLHTHTHTHRHKRCVQKLVEAGADIRQHDNEGLTAVSGTTD